MVDIFDSLVLDYLILFNHASCNFNIFVFDFKQWCTFARVWYLINADRQPAGSLAKVVSNHLQGIHKPMYSPSSDVGDHVVVVNAKEIALSGNKWEQKTFHSNTG